jgi:hypothetical protein
MWFGSYGRFFFGAFLPDVKHGSGVGDYVDGGGVVPEKGQ